MPTTVHPPRFRKSDRNLIVWTLVYIGVILGAAYLIGFEPLSAHSPVAPLDPCELHGTLSPR